MLLKRFPHHPFRSIYGLSAFVGKFILQNGSISPLRQTTILRLVTKSKFNIREIYRVTSTLIYKRSSFRVLLAPRFGFDSPWVYLCVVGSFYSVLQPIIFNQCALVCHLIASTTARKTERDIVGNRLQNNRLKIR